jgi:hypothetical protein
VLHHGVRDHTLIGTDEIVAATRTRLLVHHASILPDSAPAQTAYPRAARCGYR